MLNIKKDTHTAHQAAPFILRKRSILKLPYHISLVLRENASVLVFEYLAAHSQRRKTLANMPM